MNNIPDATIDIMSRNDMASRLRNVILALDIRSTIVLNDQSTLP